MHTAKQSEYYQKIKKLNLEHYAGEVSYYSSAPLRPAEKALLSQIQKGAKILDVGCGSGRFSINAAKMGFNVTGVDITPEAIEACKQRAKEANLTNANFLVLDISERTLLEKYDAVFCPRFVINAISTDDRRKRAIANMRHACKQSGSIYIESFNIGYLGKGPLRPAMNLSKYMARKVRMGLCQALGIQYTGLLPGDIVYKANKVEAASIGYAHLPTIWEIRKYLRHGTTKSIHEITGTKKFDILRFFRYSIWIYHEKN